MSKKSIKQKKKAIQRKADHDNKKLIKSVTEEVLSSPPNDFELIVGDENNEILNGDLPVQWCLSNELIQIIQDLNVVDPHILIISTAENDHKEMSRQLIPITQLKTYVRSTKAGAVTIHAWIIHGKEGRKSIHNKYMRKSGGYYEQEMIGYRGAAYSTLGTRVIQYTSCSVTVPEGVFGKEPGPKIKWFVNLWHEGKGVDECNYRQRKLLAFTLKWEAMILYMIAMTTFRVMWGIFLVSVGFRKVINLKYLHRVFDFSIHDVFNNRDRLNNELDYYYDLSDTDYVWKYKYTDTKYSATHTQILSTSFLFFPIVMFLILWGVVGLVDAPFSHIVMDAAHIWAYILTLTVAFDVIVFAQRKHWLVWVDDVLSMAGGAGYTIIRVLGVGLGCVFAGTMIYNYTDAFLLSLGVIVGSLIGSAIVYFVLSKLYDLYDISVKNNDITQLKEIICEECEDPNIPAVRAIIPKQKHTLKLRYLETKNRICKPMQS